MKRNKRRQALQNQIERLRRRIHHLKKMSRIYSWIRLSLFLVGAIFTGAVFTYGNTFWGSIVLSISIALFFFVVFFHRKLENGIEIHRLWISMKSDQLNRMDLNWDGLPVPAMPDQFVNHPLAIDLDLVGPHSLHHLIDSSITHEGSQLLAQWLSLAEPEIDLFKKRQHVVKDLMNLSHFRNHLGLKFKQVTQALLSGENILQWFKAELSVGRLKILLLVSALFISVNIGLFILNRLGLISAYWIATFCLYAIFFLLNVDLTKDIFFIIEEMDDDLGKFRKITRFLERYTYSCHQYLAELCHPFCHAPVLPSIQLRRIKIVSAAIGLRMNPVMTVILNVLFPWDFFFAWLVIRYRNRVAQSLPVWLKTFNELEALISLAGFAYLHPEYTFPEIDSNAKPLFHALNLGHPLIPHERKICNDFDIKELGEIDLITGSNMSGKSTFIKTVGINLCLAYAGAPVNATHFCSVPFRLHTCIRIKDSITDGLSYFYAEVKCLKHLLERLKSPGEFPLLFLIDEIFRGTNNRERLIGSRSYLKGLMGAHGVGLLATHDLELTSLADHHPGIRNLHFRDHVCEGELIFDYKIRTGCSPTTNALKIMRMEGLPVETNSEGHPLPDPQD